MKYEYFVIFALYFDSTLSCDPAGLATARVQNFGERERERARASESEQLARSLAQKFRNPSSRSLARVKIQEGQLALARSRKNRSSLAG